MDSSVIERDEQGRYRIRVVLRGQELLCSGLLNKGSAFSREERRTFGLEGLVPNVVTTIDQQVERAYKSICQKTEPLERYIGLAALQDRNETLFYRLLLERVNELMPIVYTPTVGEACKRYSAIFRRGRGLWITPDDRGSIAQVLANAPLPSHVRLIVATDNERILGLGDQGAGGIGIPIGKLALYTMAAGIHPSKTLPISLDMGTDNPQLLEDPLYVGYRQPRLRGQAYDELVEEFVRAVEQQFPHALLQWEDFKKQNAFDLLDRYRGRLLSFNDDIQGTAAVALAGISAASRALGRELKDNRVLVVGAGAAGIGIARLYRDAIARSGLSGDALTQSVALVDSRGMLVDGREVRDAYKKDFVWPRKFATARGLPEDGSASLPDVIRAYRPTALVGTTGEPGRFDESVVRAVADVTERPVVFPFSNPTANSEAIPEDVLLWSEGRAFVATGSPFGDAEYEGRTVRVSQGNNVYVFPGVGLGALVAEATEVTDSMFAVAAGALAEAVPATLLSEGALFPPLSDLREVTKSIAVAVVREAQKAGKARATFENDDVHAAVDREMWFPDYPEFVPA